jgi:uncharacterized ferritin-like protein (DUF455 family)
MMDSRLFAESPLRDERFDVKERWSEMTNFAAGHPEATREFLHRQMNEEIDGMEISARNLVDFPDAPWELRMAMARQCWDESRHIELFRRELEARGGFVGQYPVMSFQYRIITKIDSLVGRLVVQNRSFEAAGLDAIQVGMVDSDSSGDVELAALYDAQLADELQHVRYANVWVKRLMQIEGPRSLLRIAQAVAHSNEALRLVAGEGTIAYPVMEDLRREAGFSEAEIEAARQLAASL